MSVLIKPERIEFQIGNLILCLLKTMIVGSIISFVYTRDLLRSKGWSGRVDSNHRPQRPERCALNQAALRPATTIIGGIYSH